MNMRMWLAGVGLMVLCAAAGNARAQDLDQGLVAYYAFEDNALDSGPSGHDGTVVGAPNYVAGVRGRAMTFDGVNDSVTFPGIPNAAFAGNFSISWFMRVPAHAKYAVLSKRGSCNLTNAFDIRTTDETPSRTRFSAVYGAGFTDAFGRALTPGQWTHVAVVRDGGTVRVYTDGVAGTANTTASMNLSAVTAPFGISITPCITFGDGTVRFAGQIDELRLYNRALSAAEAAALAGGAAGALSPAVSVAPGEIAPGGQFLLNASGVAPSGRTCRGALQQLGNFTDLGPAQPNSTGVVGARLAVPSSTPPGTYTVALRCTSTPGGITRTVGSDEITVRSPITLSLSPATGFAGSTVQVQASGIVGTSFDLWFGNTRVFGPIAVRNGIASGRFAVPRPEGAVPTTVQVRGRGLVASMVTSEGATGFTQTARPPAIIQVAQSGLPATIGPDRTIPISGRIIAADGEPQRRVINLFFRSAAGRVVPLGSRDIATAADGSFSTSFRLPSRSTLDGLVVQGNGEVFYTWTEVDPLTGAIRTERSPGFQVVATGYPFGGVGNRIELVVRRGDTNQPLANAYVTIATPALVDPDPDQPSQLGTASAQARPANQFSSALTNVPGALANSCPVSLGAGFTDAQGRFTFEVSENAANFWGFGIVMPDQFGNAERVTSMLDATISVSAAHLGFMPRTIPARFRSAVDPVTGNVNLDGGYFITPGGQPLNTTSTPWQPVATLAPIEPQLAVALEVDNDGNPGALTPVVSGFAGGTLVSRYDLGSAYDLASVPPAQRICDGSGTGVCFCTTGNAGVLNCSDNAATPLGPLVFIKHDVVTGGTMQQARLVICRNNVYTCSGNDAQVIPLETSTPPIVSPCTDQGVQTLWVRVPTNIRNADGVVKGRIELRSFYTPPGGTVGRFLDANLQLSFSLLPLPAWFATNPDDRLRDRRVIGSQFGSGLSLTAEENLSGGTRTLDVSDGGLDDFNLESPQRNRTTNTRTIRASLTPGAAPDLRGETTTENRVANNVGEPGERGDSSLPLASQPGQPWVASQMSVIPIIDTGKIPLFRMTWGVPPIADATLGADFFLKAGVNTGARAVQSGADAFPEMEFITEPFSRFGIDLFFDLSAIAGLVSAGAQASSKVYLANRAEFSNGAFDPTAGQCFGFNLSATFEVCVGFCGSWSETLIEFYERTGSISNNQCVNQTLGLPWYPFESQSPTAMTNGAGSPPRPSLRNIAAPAFQIGPAGGGALAYVGRQVQQSSDALMVMPYPADRFGIRVVEPEGAKVTSVATAPLGLNHGLTVYAYVAEPLQNPDPVARIEASTQRQQIVWATYQRGSPSIVRNNLTPAGSGDGSVVLASCPTAEANCPAGGEATAVWLRRIGASYAMHHYALMYATYRPATGWTTPARVDPAAGNASDLQPTVTYLRGTGQAVVAWVRKPSAGLTNLHTRQIAYRLLDGSSPVRVPGELPSGVSWPSLTSAIEVDGAFSTERLYLAYTANVDPVLNGSQPRGFIGNTNALRIARCVMGPGGQCPFEVRQVRDERGRDLRVERPTIHVDRDGGLQIGARGLGFGPGGGGIGTNLLVQDPIGMVSGQGSAIMVRTGFGSTPAVVLDLDPENLGALAPAVAFDSALGQLAMVSQPLRVGAGVVADAAKTLGLEPAGKAKSTADLGGLRMQVLGTGTDLSISASSTTTVLTPGAAVPVSVSVRNLGAPFTGSGTATARVVATWDDAAGATEEAAGVALGAIATGATNTQVLNVPVPQGFAPDLPRTLVLTVVASDGTGEADGKDNVTSLEFNALPRPENVRVEREPGFPTIYLQWDAPHPADDRVVGYRVMRVAEDGSRIPLGSTPVNGFADLLAPIGQPRRYVIVAYSANGAQSDESEIVHGVALPAPNRPQVDPVFADGFEAPTP